MSTNLLIVFVAIEYFVQYEFCGISAKAKVVIILFGKPVMMLKTETSEAENVLPTFFASFGQLLLLLVFVYFFLKSHQNL